MEAIREQSNQFLGEIETEIEIRHGKAPPRPGEHINLEREAKNRRDPHAIRVENGRFEPVGYH